LIAAADAILSSIDITVDLFTELTRALDKDLRFLEAHLQS
jgi:hypothetical protein